MGSGDTEHRAGRGQLPGTGHTLARLSDENVREIRTSALTARECARQFQVSRTHVINIRAGRRWRHLDPPAIEGTP